MFSYVLNILFLQCVVVNGATILGVLNAPYLSHHNFAKSLLEELVKRGHQVTVLSPYANIEPVSKATNILLEGALMLPSVAQWKSKLTPYRSLVEGKGNLLKLCDRQLGSQGVQDFLQRQRTFDLIFMEATGGECFLGLVHHFGSPPIIVLSSFGISPITTWELGVPSNPSYVVHNMLQYDAYNLGFWEKINNFAFHWFYLDNHYNTLMHKHDAVARKYFGNHIPFLGEVTRNVMLALMNVAPGIDDPWTFPPSMIPVGGMHIPREVKPLPQDLKTYADEAKEGFLLFSLGSSMRIANMPKEKLNILLETFRLLAPIKVLLKWEEENLPGQPDNVKINKRLPQFDVLAHPNIRAFVSHCGKLSTLEAIHHGVPVVGIPFAWDQHKNSNSLQRLGVAIYLDYDTMTTKDLYGAVQQVIYNASYKKNVQELSAVFRDQLEHPLDRAVFWTEFVLRHGHKVAKILKPASVNLTWYEYLLLDVLAVIFAVFVTVFLILLCIWKTLRTSRKKAKFL